MTKIFNSILYHMLKYMQKLQEFVVMPLNLTKFLDGDYIFVLYLPCCKCSDPSKDSKSQNTSDSG